MSFCLKSITPCPSTTTGLKAPKAVYSTHAVTQKFRQVVGVVQAGGKAQSPVEHLAAKPDLPKNFDVREKGEKLPRPRFVTSGESMRSLSSVEALVREAESDLSNGLDRSATLTKYSTICLEIIQDKIFRPGEFVEMLRGLSHIVNLSSARITRCSRSLKLLVRISTQVDRILQNFSAEEISWLFHAYGSFGPEIVTVSVPEMSMPVVLSHMCLQTELILFDMDPWQVSRIMWGLGNLNYRTCESLLEALVHHISPSIRRGEYHPKSIASIMWALGRLQFVKGPMLMKALCTEAKRHIQEMSTNDVVLFVWGLSQLKRHHTLGVLEAAHEYVYARMVEFTCSDAIDLTFAFTRLSFYTGKDYMESLASRILASASSMSGTDMSKFVYCCGVQGHSLEPLETTVKEHFKSFRKKYRICDSVSLLWSLALCNSLDKEVFSFGMQQVDPSICSTSMKVQIYQCILHLEIVNNERRLEIKSQKFVDECRGSWMSMKRNQHCLQTKNVVLSILESMGYSCNYSEPLWDDAFVVPIVRNAAGESAVVDVSYPQQFFANNCNLLLQTNEWFLEAYCRMGHKVLRLREDRWNQVPKHSRFRHLQGKLDLLFSASE